jgi:hypothetical protein
LPEPVDFGSLSLVAALEPFAGGLAGSSGSGRGWPRRMPYIVREMYDWVATRHRFDVTQ